MKDRRLGRGGVSLPELGEKEQRWQGTPHGGSWGHICRRGGWSQDDTGRTRRLCWLSAFLLTAASPPPAAPTVPPPYRRPGGGGAEPRLHPAPPEAPTASPQQAPRPWGERPRPSARVGSCAGQRPDQQGRPHRHGPAVSVSGAPRETGQAHSELRGTPHNLDPNAPARPAAGAQGWGGSVGRSNHLTSAAGQTDGRTESLLRPVALTGRSWPQGRGLLREGAQVPGDQHSPPEPSGCRGWRTEKRPPSHPLPRP